MKRGEEMKKTLELRVLIGCTLIAGTSIALFGNCIGAFVRPVSEQFGFSRGPFALSATCSTLLSAFTLPLYTAALKRFPTKVVMLLSATGCISSAIFYSFSAKLWQFYAAAALNGLFINGVTMLTVSTLLSNYFRERLSFAVGVAFSGMGVICAVTLPVIRFVIAHYSAQWGYRLLALLGVVILYPCILFLIKEPKRQREEPAFSSPGIQKQTSFWLVCVGLFLLNFCNLALYNNAIAYLSDLRYGEGFISLALSMALLSMAAAKPTLGHLCDRLTMPKACFLFSAIAVASGMLALFAGVSKLLCLLFALSLSFFSTVNSIPASGFAQQLFCDFDYPKTLCWLTMASYIGSAFGTPAASIVFDRTGSYTFAWYGCIALSACTAFLFKAAASRKA